MDPLSALEVGTDNSATMVTFDTISPRCLNPGDGRVARIATGG